MKIAIIGSGISGLGSLYHLSKEHTIDLYEVDKRLGGHTETHTVKIKDRYINVDTGFIVCNDLNYPNIINLFQELNVKLHKTSMSYSFSSPSISWSSNDFDNLKLLFKPAKLKLLMDIVRFNYYAKKTDHLNLDLEDWLKKNKFTKKFINSYVLPMAGAIWSSDTSNILKFPATTFLNFFKNHGLLKLINRPQWFSISNGSKSYIDKIISNSSLSNTYLSSKISITRKNNKIIINNKNHESYYDKIIFACHANQVEPLIKDITNEEKAALDLFEYNKNRVILHTDKSLMPESKKNWTAWNSYNDNHNDYVTYWMNELQDLDTEKEIFVTLGKFKAIEDELVIRNLSYEHISYSFNTLKGQEKINKLQGFNNTYYVGAHLGYGFHEDGLTSAIKVSSMINNE